MAMIKCPECGQEISNKANKCIHCGKVFVEYEIVKEEKKCNECGTVLSETDKICPNCGCPVELEISSSKEKPQEVQVSSIKVGNKTKKIIIGVIIAVVICIAGGVGYKVYSDKKAEQDYQIAYNTYIYNLQRVQIMMMDGASDAESLCNLKLKVWWNAICKNIDYETDKYTRPNGYFESDLTALLNLFLDSDVASTQREINDNQVAVKKIMKKLQEVPEGLDKCYDAVLDLNVAYGTLVDLAVISSGKFNYKDCSSDKSDAVSDFMSAYDKLYAQIPDKK